MTSLILFNASVLSGYCRILGRGLELPIFTLIGVADLISLISEEEDDHNSSGTCKSLFPLNLPELLFS